MSAGQGGGRASEDRSLASILGRCPPALTVRSAQAGYERLREDSGCLLCDQSYSVPVFNCVAHICVTLESHCESVIRMRMSGGICGTSESSRNVSR